MFRVEGGGFRVWGNVGCRVGSRMGCRALLRFVSTLGSPVLLRV